MLPFSTQRALFPFGGKKDVSYPLLKTILPLTLTSEPSTRYITLTVNLI